MDKIEMTKGLTMWKSQDGHTVTSLEVQAVKLWAKMMYAASLSMRGQGSEKDQMMAGVLSGFLLGAIGENDGDMAEQIAIAKSKEHAEGRQPLSAEVIPQ